MELRELTARRRDGTGKGFARRLRREGLVPGIIYGGTAPVPVALDPRNVMRLVRDQTGSIALLSIRLDGDPTHRAAISANARSMERRSAALRRTSSR